MRKNEEETSEPGWGRNPTSTKPLLADLHPSGARDSAECGTCFSSWRFRRGSSEDMLNRISQWDRLNGPCTSTGGVTGWQTPRNKDFRL
jgi:hypothetical protein